MKDGTLKVPSSALALMIVKPLRQVSTAAGTSGEGVVDLECLAIVGIYPGTVDIGLLAEQFRIVQLHA